MNAEIPSEPGTRSREARTGNRRRLSGSRFPAPACVLLLLLACHSRPSAPGSDAPPGWLKGQTHAHTANSGDSNTPPGDAMRWYARHGYDFVVITDHNRVTRLSIPDLLVIPGVELTANLHDCAPPPEPGLACLLHMNALFVADGGDDRVRLGYREGDARLDVYTRSLELARDRGALVQLNHPNFHYAADAALISTLARRGTLLVEIANMALDSNNPGDTTHPSTEVLWDTALMAGARIFGVASDDAHHYDDHLAASQRGEDVFVGNLGWIMVRAHRDPAAIRTAIERGDFYASNGVLLSRADVTPAAIDVAVAGETPGEHDFVLISDGAVIGAQRGRTAHFALTSVKGRYARVEVTGPNGRKAWLQPAFLR
jgi:hypothetical protein